MAEIVQDKFANSQVKLQDRKPKIQLIRSFITQFDGSLGCQKVLEKGTEHHWNEPNSTVIKTINWQTTFIGDQSDSIRDIHLRDTNTQTAVKMEGTDHGHREGNNEHGQYWKEEWMSNADKGIKRWSNHMQEHKDGCDNKWGEWREEKRGEENTGERWRELVNQGDGYWERKSEKYTEYAKKMVDNIEEAIDTVLEAPRMLRSGLNDYRNNRNYLWAEQWEEYIDGTLLTKTVLDDGFGCKTLEEKGKKLNLDKMEDVQVVVNDKGIF